MSSLLLSDVGRALGSRRALGSFVCVVGRSDVSNVVFARSASADQRLEISGRFFQLSSVCAGAPLRSGHFCGRPVVHLMSSLLLAVGRATFVYILSPSSRLFIIFLGKLLHLVIKVS